MIRDIRRINIETNFYDDEDPYIVKQQESAFISTILQKEKGAIAIYNILDTIRLQRLINSFNCLYEHIEIQENGKPNKFSSKLMLLKDLQDKRSLESESVILRGGFGEEGIDIIEKSERSLSMKKKSLSASVLLNKEAHLLRKSRKKLLDNMNKRFIEDSPNHENNIRSKSQAKFISVSKYDKETEIQPLKKEINENKKINQKLQKLESLMISIRREKQLQLTKVVHEKKYVDYLPHKQNNGIHLQNFAQEIRCLRKEVEEVREINESILEHSRSNNLINSANNENVKNNHLKNQEVIKTKMQSNKGIEEQTESIPRANIENNNTNSQKFSKQIKTLETQNNSRQFLSRFNHSINVGNDKDETVRSNSSDELPASLEKYKITTKIKIKTDENQKKRDEKLKKFQEYLAKREQSNRLQETNQQNQLILDKYKLKDKRNHNEERLKREPSISESEEMRTIIKEKNTKQEKKSPVQDQPKLQNLKTTTEDLKLNFPSHLTQDPPSTSGSYKEKEWYKEYGSPRIPISSSFESSTFESPNYKTASDLYNISTHRSYLNSQTEITSPKYEEKNYGSGSSSNYQSGNSNKYGTYGTTYESSSGINYGTKYEDKPYVYDYGFKKEDDILGGYEKKYEYGNYGLSEYSYNASSDRNDVSSGYTNPQLLKELNLGEYRQEFNKKTNLDPHYTTTNPPASYQNTSSRGTFGFESKHMPTILERESEEYSKFGHYGNSNDNRTNLIEGDLNTTNRDWIKDGVGVSGYEGLYHKYSREST